MSRKATIVAGISTLATVLVTASTAAAAPAPHLDVYVGDVQQAALTKLVDLGVDRRELDLSAAKAGAKGTVHVETILSGEQAQELAGEGVTLTPKEIDGQTVSQRATAKAAAGIASTRSTRARRTQGGVRADRPPAPADHQARKDRQDDQRRRTSSR